MRLLTYLPLLDRHFPRVRFILSLTPYDSSPLLCVRVTHFLSVYPKLFCHVIFTLLRTYVSISTTLMCIFPKYKVGRVGRERGAFRLEEIPTIIR